MEGTRLITITNLEMIDGAPRVVKYHDPRQRNRLEITLREGPGGLSEEDLDWVFQAQLDHIHRLELQFPNPDGRVYWAAGNILKADTCFEGTETIEFEIELDQPMTRE